MVFESNLSESLRKPLTLPNIGSGQLPVHNTELIGFCLLPNLILCKLIYYGCINYYSL